MTLRIIGVGIGSGHTIQVMTEKPHDVTAPTLVTIVGVKGVPDANGTHTVAPNGPTKLVLEGSTFSGTYINGGAVEY